MKDKNRRVKSSRLESGLKNLISKDTIIWGNSLTVGGSTIPKAGVGVFASR